MPESMQLGEFPCPGSCGKLNYKNVMSLQGHIRACIAKNEVGKPGQNGCWQPGFSPAAAAAASMPPQMKKPEAKGGGSISEGLKKSLAKLEV